MKTIRNIFSAVAGSVSGGVLGYGIDYLTSTAYQSVGTHDLMSVGAAVAAFSISGLAGSRILSNISMGVGSLRENRSARLFSNCGHTTMLLASAFSVGLEIGRNNPYPDVSQSSPDNNELASSASNIKFVSN